MINQQERQGTNRGYHGLILHTHTHTLTLLAYKYMRVPSGWQEPIQMVSVIQKYKHMVFKINIKPINYSIMINI